MKLTKCEHPGCTKTNPPFTLLNNDGAGWFCGDHHNEREAAKAVLAAKEKQGEQQ